MLEKIVTTLLICITALPLSSDLPVYWLKAGSHPEKYEMNIDRSSGQQGKNAATIRSIDKKINGFGTIMQKCLPGIYLAEKIKMTGYIKSKEVADWAGFWLRIDQAGSASQATSIALSTPSVDNIKYSQVKGTTEWLKYEVVLYVPSNASSISYGAMLKGTGQIWVDNIKIEIVDNALPVTKLTGKRYNMEEVNYDILSIATEPANLTFEDY